MDVSRHCSEHYQPEGLCFLDGRFSGRLMLLGAELRKIIGKKCSTSEQKGKGERVLLAMVFHIQINPSPGINRFAVMNFS